MFQITEMTEAHVASVTNRVEKHGDDEKPAVSIGLEITAANTLLDAIDPKLRHALYMAVESQDQLPGVEPATPVLRCNSFEKHTLTVAHEGWTLAVDDGIDGTEPMVFGGAKVDKFVVDAKQGGSIVLRFRVGTSDVDADKLGKLAMHNGQSIWITLKAPTPKKDEPAIDGTQEEFDRDHPDAGTLFAQAQGEDGGDGPGDPDDDGDGSEGGETDAGDALYADAVAHVRETKRASISSVQRALHIGYNRAARLLERMETEGVISATDGDGKREVLEEEASS